MSLDNINILAVIVSGAIFFVLGALWYSPLLFAKQYMRLRGVSSASELQSQGQSLDYAITFVAELATALALAVIVRNSGATQFVDGILVGLGVGLGIAGTSTLVFAIFSVSGQSKGLWLLNAGYILLAFAIMGVILTLWR
jgi:hypothetical protein